MHGYMAIIVWVVGILTYVFIGNVVKEIGYRLGLLDHEGMNTPLYSFFWPALIVIIGVGTAAECIQDHWWRLPNPPEMALRLVLHGCGRIKGMIRYRAVRKRIVAAAVTEPKQIDWSTNSEPVTQPEPYKWQ